MIFATGAGVGSPGAECFYTTYMIWKTNSYTLHIYLLMGPNKTRGTIRW